MTRRYAVMLGAALLVAGFCQPVFAVDRDAAVDKPIDPEAMTARFADRLGKMLDEGKPVAPDWLREGLPDKDSFVFEVVQPSDKELRPAELYATCRQSTVMIGKIARCEACDNWHTSIATGFVIGREGIVVTNQHVIDKDEQAKAIAVQTWDGRLLAIQKVLAVSKQKDLAVLKVDADDLVPLPVAKQAPVGTPVYVISHPVKHFYAMTDGIVSGQFLRRDGGAGPKYREMTITADFAKGSSGGPVLDATGAVVGIVRRTTPVYANQQKGIKTNQQMVWKSCIPSASLLELLAEPSK